MSALVLSSVEYRFSSSSARALCGVNLTAEHGEILGIIGPDGAGKTTLMRILSGLLKPSGGVVTVLGKTPVDDHGELAGRVGYMPQKSGLYEELTVSENMNLFAALNGLPENEVPERSRFLLESTGLSPFADRAAGKLSGGMKQKLGISCALLGDPEVLLLDEPGVGVDPLSRREIWELVKFLAGGKISIVWATAYLDEAARFDRVCLLHEGRVMYEGPPRELVSRLEGRVIELSPGTEDRRGLLKEVMASSLVKEGVAEGRKLRLILREPFLAPEWGQYQGAKLVKPSFEEAFVDLMEREKRPQIAGYEELTTGFSVESSREEAVRVEGLTRRFGAFVAVDRIDFSVRKGEIFGLLGPNGAGKTTVFRMMCGLLKPTEGRVEIQGRVMGAEVRRKLGYMAQKFSLYGTLSVERNLMFFAGLYGLGGSGRKRRVREVGEQFQLGEYWNQSAGGLPLGIRQRLSLACAVVHDPAFLFLDEPTSGVDPLVRREFWERINGMAGRGVTVIVTTHFMDEAQYMDRLLLIDGGRIVASGSPEELCGSAASPENSEPTMEEAFICLIQKKSGQGGGAR